MSVLLVYATQWTTHCVALAILIGTYQLVNDIRARRDNTSVFAALHSRALGQSSTSGTECHTDLIRSRVQLYKRLSQLALDLMASPASQAYVER